MDFSECHRFHDRKWGNKLRTYKLFNYEYWVENYYKVLVPFNDRSAFAKLRCVVVPIRLETGRYENIKLERKILF